MDRLCPASALGNRDLKNEVVMRRKSLLVPFYCAATAVALALPITLKAAPAISFDSGMTPDQIQSLVDTFRLNLDNPITLDWDSTDDASSAPTQVPNSVSIATPGNTTVEISTPGSAFEISADSDNPTATAPRFGNVDPSYESLFQPFSGERMARSVDSTEINIDFTGEGFEAPATVTGFGAVFSGVDAFDSTSIEFFDLDGNSLTTVFAPQAPAGGLSFVGVTFDGPETIGSIQIFSGTDSLGSGAVEGAGVDLVVIDDIIFSSPVAVPEPSTFALLGLGMLGLLYRHRRRTN